MDLERLLREARPSATTDLAKQNSLVCATLANRNSRQLKWQRSILGRFCWAVMESPIPTLTASACLLTLLLWQASSLLGERGNLLEMAAILLNRGMLP